MTFDYKDNFKFGFSFLFFIFLFCFILIFSLVLGKYELTMSKVNHERQSDMK